MVICKCFSIIILSFFAVYALPENCYEEAYNAKITHMVGNSSSLQYRFIQRGHNIFLRCPIREVGSSVKVIWRHGESMLKLRQLSIDFPCPALVVGDNFLSLDIDTKNETEGFFGCIVLNVVTRRVVKELLVFFSFYEPRMLSTKYALFTSTKNCSNETLAGLQNQTLKVMKAHCFGCKVNVSFECKGNQFPYEKGNIKQLKGGESLTLQEGGLSGSLENLGIGCFIIITNCKQWTSPSDISLEASIPSFSGSDVLMVNRKFFKMSFHSRIITIQRLDIGGGSSSTEITVPVSVSGRDLLDIGIEFCFESLKIEICFKPSAAALCETTHISSLPIPGATSIFPNVQKILFSGDMNRYSMHVRVFHKMNKKWTEGPQQWGTIAEKIFGKTFRYSQFESDVFKVMSVTSEKQANDTLQRVNNFFVAPSVPLVDGKLLFVDVALDAGFLGSATNFSTIRLAYSKDGYVEHFTQTNITCTRLSCKVKVKDSFSRLEKTLTMKMSHIIAMDNVLNVVFVIDSQMQRVFMQNTVIFNTSNSLGNAELKNVIVTVLVGKADFSKDNFVSVSSSVVEGHEETKLPKLSLLNLTDVYFREAVEISEFTPTLGSKYIKFLLTLEDQDISNLVMEIPPSCYYIDCNQAIVIEHLRGPIFKKFVGEVSKLVKPFALEPLMKTIEEVRYSCPENFSLHATSIMLCQKCEAGTQKSMAESGCSPCDRKTYQTTIGEQCISCDIESTEPVLWSSCFTSNESFLEKGEEGKIKEKVKESDNAFDSVSEKFAWRPQPSSIVFYLFPLLIIMCLTGGLFLIFITKLVVRFLHFP